MGGRGRAGEQQSRDFGARKICGTCWEAWSLIEAQVLGNVSGAYIGFTKPLYSTAESQTCVLGRNLKNDTAAINPLIISKLAQESTKTNTNVSRSRDST